MRGSGHPPQCVGRLLGSGLDADLITRYTLADAQINAYALSAGTRGTAGCFGRLSEAGVERYVPICRELISAVINACARKAGLEGGAKRFER